MTESSTIDIFFTLLRAGLWNKPVSKEYFPLSKQQWNEIFQLSRKQTVEAIVYDGIMTLPDELFPDQELLYKWVITVDIIEQRNQQMDCVISELSSLFVENQIDDVLLIKGQGIASCYHTPHHRSCGDADFLFFDKKDFYLADSVLNSKGIFPKKASGFSSEYVWKNVPIEHHRMLFDSHNLFAWRELRKLYKNELQHSIKLPSGVTIPSPLITILIVNTHILKHTLSFGIGIRQFCDSARIYYKYSQQIDGNQLYKIYNDIGIIRWIHILHQVLVKNIGLDPQFLPFPMDQKDDPTWMYNEILQSGNFGFDDQRFGISDDNKSNAVKKLTYRFRLNIKYAPKETLFFPFVRVWSRIANYF